MKFFRDLIGEKSSCANKGKEEKRIGFIELKQSEKKEITGKHLERGGGVRE